MLVAVVAVAGCGADDMPATGDAAIDARLIDGGIDGPPGDGDMTDGAPGLLDGLWRLTWTCTANCTAPPNRPGLTYSGQVTVDGDNTPTVRYRDASCTDCSSDQQGVRSGTSCVDVPAGVEPLLNRAAYRLCNNGGQIEGTITWTVRFGPPGTTTWQLRGVL